MTLRECDVAVIGAGSAGMGAESAARKQGASTLLIDPEFIGTLCANTGCMPSKLLIAAAEAAHGAAHADLFGVHAERVSVDGRQVMARVRAERDKFAANTRKHFDRMPEGICVRARARFTGPNELALDNGDRVTAKAVVIATGSAPVVPKPFAGLGKAALTNENLFELEGLPGSLAVIGGGAIGLEVAQAMARLGVKVALFDQGDRLGGARSDEIQLAVRRHLQQEVALHLGVNVTGEEEGHGARLRWNGAEEGEARFDKVLIATGRAPNLRGLDLEKAGLELNEKGVPLFDRHTLQSGEAPVFIAGDANADLALLHEASVEGAIAGKNAAHFPAVTVAQRAPAFALTFTDPPLAVLSEPADQNAFVGHASYEDQGRAKVEGRNVGLVRLYGRAPDGRLTGAELFAPGADHMAHFLMLAIMRGETASSLLDMPFYHPTLEEGLKPALREICRAARLALSDHQEREDPPGA